MKCWKCGNENRDDSLFCEYCEASLTENPNVILQPQQNMWENNKKNNKLVIALVGIAVVIFIQVLVIVFLLMNYSKDTKEYEKENAKKQERDVEDVDDVEKEQEAEDEIEIETESVVEEEKAEYLSQLINCDTSQYNYTGLNKLDLSLRNYAPNQKQEGMDWDSALFYTLEDVYTDSTQDNQIANYLVLNYDFQDAKNGNLIRCIVYKNPQTEQIHKIVTLQRENDGYHISDYYYDNEKVNFVFSRNVDVYTPTYATIDKVGKRYYFNNDVMVRYRTIDVPKQIVQRTLNQSITWYPNTYYFSMSNEEKEEYDAVEYQILNEAYNVYDAVKNQTNLYEVKGVVYSNDYLPLENVSVAIIDSTNNTVLYSTKTMEDGSFKSYVQLDNTDCYMQIYLDGYFPIYIFNLRLDESLLSNVFSRICLSSVEASPIETQLYLYNSIDLTGKATSMPVQNAQVVIRNGLNAKTGEGIVSGSTGDEGVFVTSLMPDAYTAEYSVDGYALTYENFFVLKDSCVVKGYTVPTITDNAEKIVLCWDSDIDLDLLLYTPEKSLYGNMNYINAKQPLDNYRNFLVADAVDSHCEVINLSNELSGQYKLFVNNYTGYQNGTFDSYELAQSGARVYIYSKNGLIAVYYVDMTQAGIVWNVCEKGYGYYPCSIISSNVEEYGLIDKTGVTKDELLELYKEFLRGNISAEYEGNQITYNSLLWDIYDSEGYCRENSEMPSEDFALTDYDRDDIPELMIHFVSMSTSEGVIYSVKMVDDKLEISIYNSHHYQMDLDLYVDGSTCWSSAMFGGFESYCVYDEGGNQVTCFELHYSDMDDEFLQEMYESCYNSGIKYVYLKDNAYEGDNYEVFYNIIRNFETEYCKERVTFFSVEESSIQENLKWD